MKKLSPEELKLRHELLTMIEQGLDIESEKVQSWLSSAVAIIGEKRLRESNSKFSRELKKITLH